ncbi:MAG: hypothetical protein E6G57_06710 [Actinobacteria bacterium]|nr:MAG: hypothetical protein E6G57_06710 [Actinomycetota bacterium]
MFTLFSVPKPFRGHVATIQTNAVRSWTLLGSDHEIVLLGADEGVAEVAERLGVRHVPHIQVNAHGTPLMSSVFEQAQRVATHDWLCYVNCDIILTAGFARAMRRGARIRRPVLVSGRRWRLDVDEQLDFESGWERHLRRRVRAEGIRDGVGCMDYFAFRRGLVGDFPDFALGRGRWDSVLPYRARAAGALFVDATPRVLAVHQNHDYAIVTDGGDRRSKAGIKASAEGRANGKLVPRDQKCTLGNADRRMARWRLKRAFGQRLRYRLWLKLSEADRDTRIAGLSVRELRKKHKVKIKRMLAG